ncbi:MAG: hypothetical protein BEN18_05355 [Epulopiscium sp. Nuni2H_MBin001]|nr:MAG: hypothetical protein BEN18_05355 [Epulopiscium sp. Nuni2H_MBin001]
MIRFCMFVSAFFLYYKLIFHDMSANADKVILVITLLAMMQVIKMRSNKTFKAYSKMDLIDSMDSSVFVSYVAELYKRFGYTVSIADGDNKKFCDLVVFKGSKKIYLKCFHQEAEIEEKQFENINSVLDTNKNARFITVTNSSYPDYIASIVDLNRVEVKDRKFIARCISQFTQRKSDLLIAKFAQK